MIMITPQFTYDNTGNKVGVFLPIEDWYELMRIPGVDELSEATTTIPEWQKELGRKELKNVADGTTELMDWEEAKKHFNL